MAELDDKWRLCGWCGNKAYYQRKLDDIVWEISGSLNIPNTYTLYKGDDILKDGFDVPTDAMAYAERYE